MFLLIETKLHQFSKFVLKVYQALVAFIIHLTSNCMFFTMYFVFVNAKTRKRIKGFEASNALVIDFIFNEGRKNEIYIKWRT